VHEGVVDLKPERRFKRSFAQSLMESPTIARIYDGTLWRRSGWQQKALGILLDDEVAIVMNAAQAEPSATLLDVACGSGVYARLFARAMPRGCVVGMDISMPMLTWAARKDQQENTTNVAYLRADAHELPFDDASFERVNCCGALHLFPDLDAVLAEIHRVMKPGGRFTTGTFRKRMGVLGRMRTGTGHSMGVNCFTPEGVVALLKRRGFDDVQVHHDRARWMILSATKGGDSGGCSFADGAH
jgi:SAM-dependent methyltransferase